MQDAVSHSKPTRFSVTMPPQQGQPPCFRNLLLTFKQNLDALSLCCSHQQPGSLMLCLLSVCHLPFDTVVSDEASLLLGLLSWCKQVPLAQGLVYLWLLRASFPSCAHLSNYRVNGWDLTLPFAWCCSWFCFLTRSHASLTLPFSSLFDRKVYSGCEHFTGYILAGNYSM